MDLSLKKWKKMIIRNEINGAWREPGGNEENAKK